MSEQLSESLPAQAIYAAPLPLSRLRHAYLPFCVVVRYCRWV